MQHKFEYLLHDEVDSMAWAKQLAKVLEKGDVLAFSGELGTGKSVMSRAMMRALGVQDEALPSPTYAIIQEYDGMLDGDKDCRIAHMDLYRLESIEDADMLGIREFFEGSWICLIEWAERAQALLPTSVLHIELSYVQGDVKKRHLCLSGVTAEKYATSIGNSWSFSKKDSDKSV
ncbi:MAG: tRNA (adenosine(37)-N6)-threonylcarbamoyltransferase complex ATPase subunit type 1 TsaE [Mariprofundaceae bacterium]|nr:tRNA (adenosine(37)-N6)-threonylcarbamoyltransferase complex ATPase subunit type 1 TsaE [Mariprofundaceae bacterium]